MTNHIFWRNAGGVSILTIVLLTVCALISACSDGLSFWTEDPEGNKISIGGIDTDAMTVSAVSSRAAGVSRATSVDAETISWLLQPLKEGIDITYGLYGKANNYENVAILKLKDSKPETTNPDYDTDSNSRLAVYTFKYRTRPTGLPSDLSDFQIDSEYNAIWYNNGPHYFQGVHVPGRIRYTSNINEIEGVKDGNGEVTTVGKAPGLLTDQHDAKEDGTDAQLGNYTLLSHYLAMPANFRLTATVERVRLPFRHRLARVIAFVLIDPELNTTLKGYKRDKDGEITENEDPTTTSFRFCNVKVLQGVKDEVGADDHHTLTPTWDAARKVIPHFEGEKGSYSYKTGETLDADFKYYYHKDEDSGHLTQLFPTSDGWKAVHDATNHNGFTEVDYGKVPVYDIIVQPTYTTTDSVMYDEENYATNLTALAAQTNKIDFEIELENGLRYEKRFEFDLNANYQTVVYLRIAREHVDYNDAGSSLWIEDKNTDGWYGVDNENGNTLSFAGSSWQRAYTYGVQVENGEENYTTPHASEGVTDGKFYNATSSPSENEHAQYFTSAYKDMWVDRFLQAYKDGKHHGDYFILCDNIEIDARKIPENFVFTGHLDGQDKVITLTNAGETVVDKEAWDENNYVLASETDYSRTLFEYKDGSYTVYQIPTLYSKVHHDAVYYTQAEIDDAEEGDAAYNKTTSDVKTPAYDEYVEAHPTIADLMGSTTYYSDNQGTEYSKPTLYANHPIHHDAITHQSPAYLFAGLNGTYTTAQENAPDPYDAGVNWEANVHQETNKTTVWVPTAGYRAEVINVRVANSASLFKEGATASGSNPDITGNVQNCWSKWTGDKQTSTRVEYTPDIPQYK